MSIAQIQKNRAILRINIKVTFPYIMFTKLSEKTQDGKDVRISGMFTIFHVFQAIFVAFGYVSLHHLLLFSVLEQDQAHTNGSRRTLFSVQFFHFHADLANILSNNTLVPPLGWRP